MYPKSFNLPIFFSHDKVAIRPRAIFGECRENMEDGRGVRRVPGRGAGVWGCPIGAYRASGLARRGRGSGIWKQPRGPSPLFRRGVVVRVRAKRGAIPPEIRRGCPARPSFRSSNWSTLEFPPPPFLGAPALPTRRSLPPHFFPPRPRLCTSPAASGPPPPPSPLPTPVSPSPPSPTPKERVVVGRRSGQSFPAVMTQGLAGLWRGS